MGKETELKNRLEQGLSRPRGDTFWTPFLLRQQIQKGKKAVKEISKRLEHKEERYDELLYRIMEEEAGMVSPFDKRFLKGELVNAFRELWTQIPRDDEPRKTALAVVHGILERATEVSIEQSQDWIWAVYTEIIKGKVASAHELEKKARKYGLPVMDMERDPVDTRAMFGIVREVEGVNAILSMNVFKTSGRKRVWEKCVVPIIELPQAYVTESAWVAWVERSYEYCGNLVPKGRFEPASLLVAEKVSWSTEFYDMAEKLYRINYDFIK